MPKIKLLNNRKRTKGRNGLSKKYLENLREKNLIEFLRQTKNKNQRTGRR